MKSNKQTKTIFLVLLFVCLFSLGYFRAKKLVTETSDSAVLSEYKSLKSYSEEDLKEFDGADENKPIYIGLNGVVYDVSAGREFYKTDGPYHYLAGKDSSTELNMVGGSIIKKKYPIVGKLK